VPPFNQQSAIRDRRDGPFVGVYPLEVKSFLQLLPARVCQLREIRLFRRCMDREKNDAFADVISHADAINPRVCRFRKSQVAAGAVTCDGHLALVAIGKFDRRMILYRLVEGRVDRIPQPQVAARLCPGREVSHGRLHIRKIEAGERERAPIGI